MRSALKSPQSEGGKGRRRKMVRFADAMGFDLHQIRHILDDFNDNQFIFPDHLPVVTTIKRFLKKHSKKERVVTDSPKIAETGK